MRDRSLRQGRSTPKPVSNCRWGGHAEGLRRRRGDAAGVVAGRRPGRSAHGERGNRLRSPPFSRHPVRRRLGEVAVALRHDDAPAGWCLLAGASSCHEVSQSLGGEIDGALLTMHYSHRLDCVDCRERVLPPVPGGTVAAQGGQPSRYQWPGAAPSKRTPLKDPERFNCAGQRRLKLHRSRSARRGRQLHGVIHRFNEVGLDESMQTEHKIRNAHGPESTNRLAGQPLFLVSPVGT